MGRDAHLSEGLVPYGTKWAVSKAISTHIQCLRHKLLISERKSYHNDQNPIADNLSFKRLEDGKNAWVWGGRFSSTEAAVTFDYGIYTHGSVLFYNYGPRGYGIDQETGQTIGRKEWTQGTSRLLSTTGLGSHFYFTGTPPDTYAKKRFEESIYQGDMATGAVREVAKLKPSPTAPGTTPSATIGFLGGAASSPSYEGLTHCCW